MTRREGWLRLDCHSRPQPTGPPQAQPPTRVDGTVELRQGVEHHRLQAANAVPHPAGHVLQPGAQGRDALPSAEHGALGAHDR
jgi:hypothetical protein